MFIIYIQTAITAENGAKCIYSTRVNVIQFHKVAEEKQKKLDLRYTF